MNTIRHHTTLRHTFIAIALSAAAQAASADAFAPWAQHAPMAPATQATAAIASPMHAVDTASGFAPWTGHTMLHEMGGAATRMGDAFASVFRPWS